MDNTSSPEAAPYMLLFRNTGPENYQGLSADQRQRAIERWNAWFESLVAQGKAIEGQPLESETRLVSGRGGARITDGPFPESKEAIGGYVTLLVQGMDEATEVARSHPGLEYGLEIEIRPLTAHCHLGVTTRSAFAARTV